MYHKFLSLFCVVILSPAFASEVSGLPDAWIGTHYGTCYASVEEAMSDSYGPDYDTDDNIGAKHLTYGADEMVISVDHTSGTNAPRTVFEKRAGGKWCVILTSPPVASLAPIIQDGIDSKPLQWVTLTQAAPGHPETKIVYTWKNQEFIYFPSHCYHVGKQGEKEFDCKNAYKE